LTAISHDIELRTGSTFTLPISCAEQDPDTLQLAVRDLTGWTGAMQIRPSATSDTILAEAAVTIDVASGTVTATIDDVDTADMTWRSGVYDLIITDGTETDPLAAGVARLVRGVTRS
jgi:hypothetical protein